MSLTHLSLFSGIGGLDLAAEAAGFVTVGQCEWADYPTKILERHWPDVPRWRDIRTLTKESFYEKTGLRTVDVISGGFPCQPFSVAGNQKGKEDDRYLWPEMLRVIRELNPRWVVGENVPGILRIAAWDVVSGLEREGFDTVVFDFEAAAVGALHRRERIAFVAHAESAERRGCKPGIHDGNRAHAGRDKTPGRAFSPSENGRARPLADACGKGLQGIEQYGAPAEEERKSESCGSISKCGETFPYTNCDLGESWWSESKRQQRKTGIADGCNFISDSTSTVSDRREPCAEQTGWSGSADSRIRLSGQWAIEPNVGRVAHGVPNRVDRLKCLGNAVVPQQFYPFFAAIAEIEQENK